MQESITQTVFELSLSRGDCVGMICHIGGSGAGIEVNISARKVSSRRYLSFSSQEDTKLLASSHASLAESSVYSTMSDNDVTCY